MKYIFIVNPVSGQGKTLDTVKNIKRVCEEEHIDYKVHFTEAPGDATNIARRYKKERNVIFSVGGDGTLNEVLNGVVGTNNMLGVVPSGSGNDFYRTLSKMDNPTPLIDVGMVNNRYFINVLSIGMDAEVAKNTDIMKKRKVPKSQIYNASIIYTFFKYKFKNIDIDFDDKKLNGKYTLLTVCNGRTYGGGFNIAPNAYLDDGYFDVYIVDKINKSIIPFLLNKLKTGTHESNKNVKKFNATKIKFKSDCELVCNVDGEILIDKKFKIKLIPKALLIYNNKDLIKKFMKR